MLETAAVYWESVVRIYGITEKTGLTLLTVIFPAVRTAYWGSTVETMAERYGAFEFVLLQQLEKQMSRLNLVLPSAVACSIDSFLQDAARNEKDTIISCIKPVELISFHGPHFQDRFGIAHGVFDTLEKSNVPLLAAGCVGTSVNLVFPENLGRQAVHALGTSFVVPKAE